MTLLGKEIELQLPCALTERELQSRSMMLVTAIGEMDVVAQAKRAAMKEFNDRLTGIEERQRELAGVLRTGVEKRMVPCRVLFHTPAEASKRIVRLDTGEIVREEAMTEAECQLNLFGSLKEFEELMIMQAPPAEDAATEETRAVDEYLEGTEPPRGSYEPRPASSKPKPKKPKAADGDGERLQ